MKRIEIYTTKNCSYCVRAKALLTEKNLDFNELDVMRDPVLMKEMVQRSKKRSVPQIFIGGVSIGGYDQLVDLNASGELQQHLKDTED